MYIFLRRYHILFLIAMYVWYLIRIIPTHMQRPSKVRVSAQDLDGKRFTINIHGFPARIFQHEFDHLQGVLFCDRWVPEGMEKHRDALVAMEEEYLKKHPQAEIQRIQQQA